MQILSFPQITPEIKQLRVAVFHLEQNIPERILFDENDSSASTTHFIVFDQHPVASCRARFYNNDVKIERFCVLKTSRGQNIGRKLVDAVQNHFPKFKLVISAQLSAEKFWEKNGFVREGEEHREADIPHVQMGRKL
ncbi:Acetyltransferase_(GNAT) family protein [Hexamita inflata]|uniref:Acetyltransferase (GNAT) family protein n=1 Tax=Hexamita inflata TaxID=28002 RepID=A0AA86NWJ2_9EUKA|nr:Acetyltransferase (GNAT) family protein [Hexamita inflata]